MVLFYGIRPILFGCSCPPFCLCPLANASLLFFFFFFSCQPPLRALLASRPLPFLLHYLGSKWPWVVSGGVLFGLFFFFALCSPCVYELCCRLMVLFYFVVAAAAYVVFAVLYFLALGLFCSVAPVLRSASVLWLMLPCYFSFSSFLANHRCGHCSPPGHCPFCCTV